MERKEILETLVKQNKTMKEIGRALGGISRQRVYQLFTQYGIETTERKKAGFWKKQSTPHRWLWRTLSRRHLDKALQWELFKFLSESLPTHCPILNIELNYNGNTRGERQTSPSIDRIDSSKGYEINNVHIISDRANRIKNDASPEELKKIYDYLTK